MRFLIYFPPWASLVGWAGRTGCTTGHEEQRVTLLLAYTWYGTRQEHSLRKELPRFERFRVEECADHKTVKAVVDALERAAEIFPELLCLGEDSWTQDVKGQTMPPIC
jgi:hypothetical protein